MTSEPRTVKVYPVPSKPTIVRQGADLSAPAAAAYQWYLNGLPIAGGTGQNYKATQNGAYSVQITDTNGCTARSDDMVIVLSGVASEISVLWSVQVTPNPFHDALTISSRAALVNANMSVTDETGREVYRRSSVNIPAGGRLRLQLPGKP